MVELMVPIFYILVFVAAYYGPNAKIIGNIGNSYWQYNAVKDVGKTIEFISIFFFIDFCSVIFCTFLLWKFCQIDIRRPFVALQKEFGMIFLLNLCYKLNGVSYFKLRLVNILIAMKISMERSFNISFKCYFYFYFRISLEVWRTVPLILPLNSIGSIKHIITLEIIK